jgi:hypothetical protein
MIIEDSPLSALSRAQSIGKGASFNKNYNVLKQRPTQCNGAVCSKILWHLLYASFLSFNYSANVPQSVLFDGIEL